MVATAKVTLKLPKIEEQQLRRIAEQHGLNRHAVLRNIVSAALKSGDFSAPEKVKTPAAM